MRRSTVLSLPLQLAFPDLSLYKHLKVTKKKFCEGSQWLPLKNNQHLAKSVLLLTMLSFFLRKRASLFPSMALQFSGNTFEINWKTLL
jgi:hypothetical protein